MTDYVHFRRRVLVDNHPFQLKELIPFVGAIITGAVGGCVASVQHARTRKETVTAFAIAYLITGAFGGLMTLALMMAFYPGTIDGWHKLFLFTGAGGIATSLALAAGNISMRIILKRLGFEVVVDIKRAEKDDSR